MDCNHTRLAVLSLDSALKKDEDYYPQVFLRVCIYWGKNRHDNFVTSGECDEE